ncbi:PAS domain S-box protein [Thiomicrospira microaerophila]|uniref:PAS domain S-box protein n=1 Tax=Thiomicrospira microaerophila TaxID=406020 RepID=UPI0006982311|nr:PAS domain S-box protein [Thiomicrospira microaerophila]
MQVPATPDNESARLAALYRLNVLDTAPEECYDRLTRLTQQMFNVPISVVSLIDADRQWFKSRQGLDVCETGRDVSFCGHAILGEDIFEIEDATQDPRFSANPLVVSEPKIRFYAGVPLITREGHAMGTLCIIDFKPRKLTEAQRSALRDLADAVLSELELHESYKRNCEYEAAQKLTRIISRAQSGFIDEAQGRQLFDRLLSDVLDLTGSEYGFIAEVRYGEEGAPYLKTYAITNIAWDAQSQASYETHAPNGMEFHNLKNLFGEVLTTTQPVIANDPLHDPRRGGLPPGHPALNRFLGLPIFYGGQLVAMLGLANRAQDYDNALIDYLAPLLTTCGQLIQAAKMHQQQEQDRLQIKRLSKVASQTSNGVVITDVEGRVEWVNDGFVRITGYTLAEMKGQKPGNVLQGADTDQHTVDKIRQALAQQQGFDVTLLNYTKTHRPYWIRIQCTPLFDQQQKLTGYMSVETDITESKLATEALQAERNLFSTGPVFVITWGPTEDWPVTYVSDNIIEILGYSPAEMMAPDFRYANLIHPDDIQRIGDEVMHNIAQHIDVYEQSYRLRMKNGAYRWFYDFTKLVRNADGQLKAIRGYMFDQTEIKKIEQTLKEQSARTKAILDNMVDGLLTMDVAGRIESSNPAAEQIFGYQQQEMAGKNLQALVPNLHQQGVSYYQAGQGHEVEGQTKQGRRLPIELSVSVVRLKGQQQYIALVRDISERKRTDQLKSEFVSTVSHELRTPLTSISGALGLIIGGQLGAMPAQMQKMIDIAHKNTLRLSLLINDLLDMEKMVSGKLHFEMSVHSLVTIINQAIENYQTYGAEHKIKLRLENEGLDVKVWVDEQRLQQVLANLLSNAIKYSPLGGQVRIALQPHAQRPNWIRVAVIDQGPGIPESFKSRIFEKFSQADASDSRQKTGTGLGLAISREIIEQMGGHIGFDSTEGQGATFWFELPLASQTKE